MNSKYVSYLLRHDKRVANLVDDQGFLSLNDLNKICWDDKHFQFTEQQLITIVNDPNTKKRFEYEYRPNEDNNSDSNSLYVRALNGHSFKLKSNIFSPWWPTDLDENSSSSSSSSSLKYIYHVTNHNLVNSILKEGLKPMARQFVHLYEFKHHVKYDGKRDTLLEIGPLDNTSKVELKLFRSKNGYLMCPHVIPGKYIKRSDKK